ncbi:FHA domain-containing protein [Sphaerospermopsis sp. FACHB-1194]|uniref:FHA domain-containing protein n=1 Tax=Sphaerospermopsis sp. FACHB-1194 TaxID=2692862 RepID=UPI0016801636|nr:FHA domain-containing protein [Sphaerospermopsis sp. FACHB-1194]MBD2145698.1 FHA domain-containing protein [Sphaerospermopsis sp. FACHB-1194]
MITCTACGYDQNPDNSEFCNACGSELQTIIIPPPITPPPITPSPITPSPITPSPIKPSPIIEPSVAPTVIQPPLPQPNYPIITNTFTTNTSTNAKIICKQINAPIPEFLIENNAIVGIFDPDVGPVDIDLETFFGGETVSRNHGEIYHELGTWKVKDLGSTNGIFIKSQGQTRFSSRITIPTPLNSGDEIAFGKVRFLFQTL